MDYAKCSGTACEIRDWCKRFTEPAAPHGWQSWIEPTTKGYECQHFMPTINGFPFSPQVIHNETIEKQAENDGLKKT
jgi:hypothetical protein